MIKVHSYLNFNGNCEAAFNFYKQVFNAEFSGIYRFGDMPEDPNYPIPEADKDKVMHVGLPINEYTMLMGSDCLESFGQKAISGSTTYIMLDVETADEAKSLHDSLTVNAQKIEMDLGETFYAELFSSFVDQFGIAWMIHFEGNKKFD